MFKNSFDYATKDWDKVFTLGLLLVIFAVLVLLVIGGAIVHPVIGVIIGILAFIAYIVVILIFLGYGLSVTRDTIHNRNIATGNESKFLPDFNWVENIIDGLKLVVLQVIYMIIPMIVAMILLFIWGIFSAATLSTVGTDVDPNTFFTTISGLLFVIIYILIILLILFFTLLEYIAVGRLAETGRFGSIFDFKEILDTISRIDWKKYIIWFIIFFIVSIYLTFFSSVLMFIPVVGWLLFMLVIPAFLVIFMFRAIGLLYNESKV